MSMAPKVFVTEQQKQTLSGLLETQAEIFGSRVSFINLADYKQTYKSDWPARLATLRKICLKVLNEKLDGNSAMIDLGESFVALFFNNFGKIQNNLMVEVARQIDMAIKSHPDFTNAEIDCRASTLGPEELKSLLVPGQAKESDNGAWGDDGNADSKTNEVLYQAVVALGRQSTIALNCMPRELIRSTKQATEKKYLSESLESKQIDLLAFEHALSIAYRMARKKDARRIVFSINFNNLKVPQFRQEYEHALKQAPKNTLERLIPKLVRVPQNTPTSTVENSIATIRHYFNYLAVEASYSKRTPKIVVDDATQRTLTCVYIPFLRGMEGEPLNAVHRKLSLASNNTKSRVLGHGIETQEDLAIAKALNVDFVCGSAVHAFTIASDVPLSVDLANAHFDRVRV